jgi:hypothetical protein
MCCTNIWNKNPNIKGVRPIVKYRLFKNIRKQIYAKKSILGSLSLSMLIILVSLSTFLVMFPERAEATVYTDFSDYRRLTIESDFIEAALTNFPILVHDDTGDLLGNVLSNASDIAFFNTTRAIQFNHEIEYYNVTTGELWAWVNVTSISNSVDTIFYMYYNDSDGGYPVDYNPTDVWDSDYLAVYHLNETTGGYNDSTANYNNATLTDGDTDSIRGASGEIDGCIDFNGDADYIGITGNNPSILGNGSDDLTISLWVNPDNIDATSWLYIVGDDNAGLDFISIGIVSSLPYYRVKDNADDCIINGLGELNNGTWFYLTLVWDASAHKLDAYENKTLLGTDTDAAVMPADNLEYDTIGAYRKDSTPNGQGFHDGTIDEVQISRNITRTRAWLNASFDNQNETPGFLTIGSEYYYYGFGDSIMRATKGGSDLAVDGSDCYVLYMQGLYDPSNNSGHNMDGGGKTTNWGYANWTENVTDWDWYVIEAFGVNDVFYDGGNDADGYPCSASIAASNKLEMYNWSVENDSETRYLPMILTLADGNAANRARATQLKHINTTMNLLQNYSVRFVKLFDAIDTIPYNGRIDAWDTNFYHDQVHPQTNGHQAMGSFLWFFVNGNDYIETYHAGNDTITIQAHYNETIYVYPQSGWTASNVVVTCVTNSTIISSDEAVDVEGNATIRFTILNESSYEIVASAVPTQSSPSPANNSVGQILTPTLSITVDDSNSLELLNVTWSSNSSGSWVDFGLNNSIDISGGAETVYQTNSNFSERNTTYYWRINVSDGNNTNIKTYNFETMGDVDPPYNGSSEYDVINQAVNLTWDRGNHSDREIVVQNNVSYPVSPTDGWVRQNGTNLWFNVSMTYSTYFTVWSYNSTLKLYSVTGLNVPWGAIAVSCFEEGTWIPLTFNLEITNEDATQSYWATDSTNIHYVDLYDIPYGDNTIFIVSADYHNQRVSYYDLDVNNYYNYSFYLPLIEGGDDPPDPEDCELRPYANSRTVTNPAVDCIINLTYDLEDLIDVQIYNQSLYDTYGGWLHVPSDKYTFNATHAVVDNTFLDINTTMAKVNYYYEYCGGLFSVLCQITVIDEYEQRVPEARILMRRLNNETGEYVNVSNDITDGNGQITVWLMQNVNYRFEITKSGYEQIGSKFWIPTAIEYTKTFRIERVIDEEGLETMWDFVTYVIEPQVNDHYTNFTMFFNLTCSDSSLEWFMAIVYLYNDSTDEWDTLYTENVSTQPTGGSINYTTTMMGRYGFSCSFKLEDYDEYAFGVPHSDDKYVFIFWDSLDVGDDLDTLLDNTMGKSPAYVGDVFVAWTALGASFVAMFVFFTFSPRLAGLGIMGVAASLAFFKVPLMLISDSVLNMTAVITIAVLGLIVFIVAKKRS